MRSRSSAAEGAPDDGDRGVLSESSLKPRGSRVEESEGSVTDVGEGVGGWLEFRRLLPDLSHRKAKNGKYRCESCKKEFISKFGFKCHQKIHTAEELLSCRYCNRQFSQSTNLINHVKIHTGEKPFSCDHCKQRFARKHHLIPHLRTHTGEKPFTCDHCKRSFSVKGNLIRHLEIHSREKPM
ncbi:gastrula zinc finger protein XlCGF49.1-like [Centruroides vittatus]|uniref:gastrula zinc finger protein XlCGF49.1-like n=1 Tax=Centruroides vittatus TaxID=120091 RepID=UPI00350EE29B